MGTVWDLKPNPLPLNLVLRTFCLLIIDFDFQVGAGERHLELMKLWPTQKFPFPWLTRIFSYSFVIASSLN